MFVAGPGEDRISKQFPSSASRAAPDQDDRGDGAARDDVYIYTVVPAAQQPGNPSPTSEACEPFLKVSSGVKPEGHRHARQVRRAVAAAHRRHHRLRGRWREYQGIPSCRRSIPLPAAEAPQKGKVGKTSAG